MMPFAFVAASPLLVSPSTKHGLRCARRPCAIRPIRAALAPPAPAPVPHPGDPASATPLARAHLELRMRDVCAARAHFEDHLRAQPCDVNAWLAWARAENSAHAERVLSRAVSCNVHDDRIWLAWARTARISRGNHAAVAVHGAAAVACPGSASLRAAHAALCANSGDLRSARELYRSATEISPGKASLYVAWAGREERARNLRAARAVLEQGVKAVTAGKDAATLYTAFAALESRQRNVQRARFLLMRASEADPRDGIVWQAWGCLEAKAGNVERARQLFERGVVVNPHHAATWQAWGMLEMRARKESLARTLFERATRADPRDSSAWHAWSQLESRAGDVDEAHRLLEEGLVYAGPRRRAASLYLTLAGMRSDIGDVEGARKLYRTGSARCNESPPDRARLLHAWARLERGQDCVECSRSLYKQALAISPRDVYCLHSLATLEDECGEHDSARSLLRKALQVAPLDVKSLVSLAYIEYTKFAGDGGVDRARQLFTRGAQRCRDHRLFMRAWSAFELAQGDEQLSKRLRTLASRARR